MILLLNFQLCTRELLKRANHYVCLPQESDIVTSVVRRLLLNFITRPHVPFNGSSYPIFSDNGEPGVLQRVGSAAGNYLLFFIIFDFGFWIQLANTVTS